MGTIGTFKAASNGNWAWRLASPQYDDETIGKCAEVITAGLMAYGGMVKIAARSPKAPPRDYGPVMQGDPQSASMLHDYKGPEGPEGQFNKEEGFSAQTYAAEELYRSVNEAGQHAAHFIQNGSPQNQKALMDSVNRLREIVKSVAETFTTTSKLPGAQMLGSAARMLLQSMPQAMRNSATFLQWIKVVKERVGSKIKELRNAQDVKGQGASLKGWWKRDDNTESYKANKKSLTPTEKRKGIGTGGDLFSGTSSPASEQPPAPKHPVHKPGVIDQRQQTARKRKQKETSPDLMAASKGQWSWRLGAA